MRKHLFNRRIAGGLAIALVVTGSLYLVAPLSSGNLANSSLFSKNSGLNVTVQAANQNLILTEDDISVSSGAIRGFTASGTALIADAAANLGGGNRISITFPDTVYPSITRIGAGAFENTMSAAFKVDLHLSNNITTIDDSAFASNYSLSSVTLGNNTQTIGNNAFKNTYISEFHFNQGLTTIGDSAFESSHLPGAITLPDTVTTMGKRAFANNDTESVTLSDGMTAIPDEAFINNSGLVSVDFKNHIQSIGKSAFLSAYLSGELELPDTITSLGEESFSRNQLTKVTIPSSITTIPTDAFSNNPQLTSVVLNEGLKVIGKEAFRNSAITTIFTASTANKLPESLEELGEGCFAKNKLTTVTLPDNIKIIRGSVFANNEITNFDFGAYANVNARRWYRDGGLAGNMVPAGILHHNKLQSITIPASVWAIGSNAFSENDLSSVTIPSRVENIYFYGFQNNPNLKTVNFLTRDDGHGNMIGISQIDRGAFDGCSIEGHLAFPDKMNEMGGFSFRGNKITSVSFGKDSPTNGPLIGYNSFENNPIESIDGLDSWQFEEEAFLNTHSLKNVSFDYTTPRPNFTRIGYIAFKGGLLKSINLPSYIKTLYDESFENNTGWINGTNKVALYRVSSVTTGGATYVTDNAIDDSNSKTYVFNPVLVKFVIKDQYGQTLPITGLDVQRTRTVSTSSITTTTTTKSALVTDFKHFKLGDKIKFAVPAAPSGYELVEEPVSHSSITKTADNMYELTLDPTDTNIVTDEFYGDNYNVGYKQTVIEIKYNRLSSQGGGGGQTPTPPAITTGSGITSGSSITTPSAVDPSLPVVPTPENPSTPDTPGNPTTPANPTTPGTPSVNPPTNVPFTPDRIINPDLIPEGNPVFNIVNEKDTPLGDAKINKDKGTYTFVDDKNETPKGVAKIHDDNTLEVVKVFDNKTPQGSLPRTGGSNENVLVLLGASLLGLGVIIRRKTK